VSLRVRPERKFRAPANGGMASEDMLLNALAVIKPSRVRDKCGGIEVLRIASADVIIAVRGRWSESAARHLAAWPTEDGQTAALQVVRTQADPRWRRHRPSDSAGSWPHRAAAVPVTSANRRRRGPADQAGANGEVRPGGADETGPVATVRRPAGRYGTRLEGTPLATFRQRLPRAAKMLVAAGILGGSAYSPPGRAA
jgi:hypothetical protein